MGNNSKQQKFNKLLHDIQIHMRLKISGNAGQVRQHYIPALFEKLVAPLQDKNAGSVRFCPPLSTLTFLQS